MQIPNTTVNIEYLFMLFMDICVWVCVCVCVCVCAYYDVLEGRTFFHFCILSALTSLENTISVQQKLINCMY